MSVYGPYKFRESYWQPSRLEDGRGGQIRTDDLYVPNVALYQAKLRPD